MHRTEATNHASNLYTEGPPATIFGAPVANALQEEICYVITQAGLTLLTESTETRTQLWLALVALGAGLPKYSTQSISATTTFSSDVGAEKTYFITPTGADRNFNPTGDFNTGYRVWVINSSGSYNIVFDAAVSAQTVSPGTYGMFIYNGAIWL